MKQGISSLDVKALAQELSTTLTTLRVSNIYDLSSKILLFKFAKPDNKKQFIVNSGFRCHLTEFTRTTAPAPSAFVTRLRGVLKTRRVSSVTQIGTDRIIEFQFSDGVYRLYLEFFAAGNVILTDGDLKILALMRNVPEGEGQEPQKVGLTYSLENRMNVSGVPDITQDRVKAALQTTIDKAAAAATAAAEGKKTKKKTKAGNELRRGLAVTINELPPILVDHAMLVTGFDSTTKPEAILESPSTLEQLVKALEEARRILDEVGSATSCKGYILAKRREGVEVPEGTEPTDIPRKDLLYHDFHPFLPKQFQKDPAYTVLTFDGFNKTVDEFYSSIEGQKLESRLGDIQAQAQRKLDAAKNDQSKRIDALQASQSKNFRMGAAIEANSERVQEAMDAVIDLIQQGMDWSAIDKLIEREKSLGNPVAELINLPLKLETNTMTLMLGDAEEEEEDEDDASETDSKSEAEMTATAPPSSSSGKLEVDINLYLTPWANAREYYEERKQGKTKEQRTVEANTMALKNVEKRVAEDLRKGLKQEKAILQVTRIPFWFEKFLWFISSDGYLVLGGRDPMQNELLYRRHLRTGDVYVHADVNRAGSVIVKNKPQTPDAPIPPATLTQAGTLAVCSSSAWDSKAGMSAWWVNADQVSKSTPSGDFMPTGSLMVKGQKNFLPAAPLNLGLGLLWRVSDESKARHMKHRAPEDIAQSQAGPSAGSDGPSAEASKKAAVEEDGAGESEFDDGEDEMDEERANPLQAKKGGKAQEVATNESLNQGVTKLNISEDKPTEAADEREESEEESSEDEEEEDDSAPVEFSKNTDAAPVTTTSTTQMSKGQQPLKRGQKAKLKRMAKKYKDQDADDRAAAEQVIGATAGRQKKEDEANAKAAKEREAEATRERRRAQHLRAQEDIARYEEARRKRDAAAAAGAAGKYVEGKGEGKGGEDGEAEYEAAQLKLALDTLVAAPMVGDEILEVIPVCAPWTALARTKYKVKLQPGSTKKGKAVKEILERWKTVGGKGTGGGGKKGVVDGRAVDMERMWPREVELMAGVRGEEVVNIVPVGKVAVMGGAGGKGGPKGGKGGGRGKRGR